MDEERVKGSTQKVKGRIKDTAGQALGDSKLQGEGKADKAEGSLRNTAGGIKDAVKDAFKK